MLRRNPSLALLFYLLCGVWCFSFLIYLLYPGKPMPFSMRGFYLSVGFYFFLLLTVLILHQVFRKRGPLNQKVWDPVIPPLVSVFFYLGIVGLLFHLYDKLFIRSYDYFSCLDIREIWLQDGARRGLKASSIASALGHLFVYCSVIPVLFLPLSRRTLLRFIVSLLVLLIYSWTLFSRSTLLLVFFMTLASSFIQFVQSRANLKNLLFKALSLSLCFCFFTFATFFKKISCADTSSIDTFAKQSLGKHSMILSDKVSSVSTIAPTDFSLEDQLFDPLFTKLKLQVELPIRWFEGESRLTYLANIVPLYATVGINNFNSVTFQNIQPDYKYLFNPFINVINRAFQTELIEPSSARSFFRLGYINLPGAIYLTFGKIGMYLVPLILGGILFLFTRHLIPGNPQTHFSLPFFSLFFSFLLLSPITNPLSLMSMPFLFFVSGLFYLASLMRGKKTKISSS